MVKNNKLLKIDVQLAQLEKIEAEKKAFDDSGVPPTLPAMKVPLSEFRAAQKKAEATCKLAFEKAAKAYRDKNELKTAAATLEEMKEFLAKTPTAAAVGAGSVVLVSTHSGKVIGLSRGNTDAGTHIVTADYVKGDRPVVEDRAATDGYAYIENVKTGLVIACDGKNNGLRRPHREEECRRRGPTLETQPGPEHERLGRLRPQGHRPGARDHPGVQERGIGIILWDDSSNNGPVRFTPAAQVGLTRRSRFPAARCGAAKERNGGRVSSPDHRLTLHPAEESVMRGLIRVVVLSAFRPVPVGDTGRTGEKDPQPVTTRSRRSC